jgi:hypothetical protein
MSDGNFIARWSRRKIEARKGEEQLDPGRSLPRSDVARDDAAPAQAAPPAPGNIAAGQAPAGAQSSEPLPPLESLTPHSDFSPFMREGVDPALKGQALKTLFSDPALYPMDGLDVYIDDYSKPDPLPEGWLEKLNQFAALDSHNQPEREARATQVPAIPASSPPTEPAQAATIQAPEPSCGPRSDTSVTPPAASDPASTGAS